MFERIIRFSLENKFLVLLGVAALAVLGIYSASRIPLDAVPDITNNQVQIVSTAPTLAPQEVEQLITFPLEALLTNIPDVVEVRSISRYGLSVITIVFEEDVEGMLARQYVQEQLNVASAGLRGIAEPELMPITTGLGEIYQYVLTVDPEMAHRYNATELRSIQDWLVKRQLNGTKGVVEVSSFGGYLKQYEVALDPMLLRASDLTIPEVISSLRSNNENSGGSYIEKGPYSFYIRTEGRVRTADEIGNILIKNRDGVPIRVRDLGDVRLGSAKRYGAMTMDGKGEVVGGITLMLKGANSSEVLSAVRERMETVSQSLPEGVHIYPYLDRSKLIQRTISTVQNNLIEGGLIVIFVLLLLLGNLRAGLIVASVIPLSMLFALTMMRYFGISANLMSLGAIDFGIVIDGAVIIVEGLLHVLGIRHVGKTLTQKEMDATVANSATRIYRSAAFGVLIILVVFIPILTLEGTEGKTFRPMAQTVGFAILGSMLLSMTYVPVMASWVLSKKIRNKQGFSDRLMSWLRDLYRPTLRLAMGKPAVTLISALVIFLFSLVLFGRMGAEFVPTLEEGDIAMQQAIKPGSSLQESIRTSTLAESILLENFPEVEHVVSKIGTAEVPTDPMAIEDADIMIILKDKEEWTSATTREALMDSMKASLGRITWAGFEFTQPIQLRFNELMTGAKSDISVKIFGEDVATLKAVADEAAGMIRGIDGAGDVKVDQTDGLQQLSVRYDRDRLAEHGVSVESVNQIIRASYAGEVVGEIFEEERRFDLVVRLAPAYRQNLDLSALTVTDVHDVRIPLTQLARIEQVEGPMLISREQARRFINIGVNLRNRDVSSVVSDIETALGENLDLPAGYEIQYGGAFENLEHATARLLVAVPVALVLILLLLFLAFGSVKDTLIIFMAVPLSAVGGILALWLRDMPFSISSGIGFIALFGVSVLNGIVLLSAIRQLKEADFASTGEWVAFACLSRLRPVLMTAAVAALGFLPMALSTGSGAEVQRPLATVVIGGLISSTLLTLLVLPALFLVVHGRSVIPRVATVLIVLLALPGLMQAQELKSFNELEAWAMENHPSMQNLDLEKQSLALTDQAKVQWGALSLDYQNGQINDSGRDHWIQANQDISPLFRFQERGQKHQLVESRLELQDLHHMEQREQWRARLKSAYSEWVYQTSRWRGFQALQETYDEVSEKLKTQFEAGALDAVEYGLLMNEVNVVRQESRRAEQEKKAAEFALRSVAFLDADISLPPARRLSFVDTASALPSDNNVYLTRLRQEQQVLEEGSRLEITRNRQADVSAGYFSQSLEREFPFQGFQLGVAIPVDTRINRITRKQTTLAQEQLQNRLTETRLEIENRFHVLDEEVLMLEETIRQYEEEILPSQDKIRTASRMQLEQGEISVLAFSTIQNRFMQQEFAFFLLLRQLDEARIQRQLLNIQIP